MSYLENELTSLRRESERLFTAAIAATVLGWGPRGEWRAYTRKHSECCASAQSTLLRRQTELLSMSTRHLDEVWFVDDFVVMLSQAHILTYFLCGFYDGHYEHDIDIPALEKHLGISQKPIALRVAEALTGGKPHPSYTPDATSLPVIKRRHWNGFIRNNHLRILSVTNLEQVQKVVMLLAPELQKNHLRDELYVLDFRIWDELRDLLSDVS